MEDVTAPAEGVSGHAQMFSNGGEMKVNDASGTITTISPHNFELIPEEHQRIWLGVITL